MGVKGGGVRTLSRNLSDTAAGRQTAPTAGRPLRPGSQGGGGEALTPRAGTTPSAPSARRPRTPDPRRPGVTRFPRAPNARSQRQAPRERPRPARASKPVGGEGGTARSSPRGLGRGPRFWAMGRGAGRGRAGLPQRRARAGPACFPKPSPEARPTRRAREGAPRAGPEGGRGRCRSPRGGRRRRPGAGAPASRWR